MKHKKNITKNESYMVYGLNGSISILDSPSCNIKELIIKNLGCTGRNYLIIKELKNC